jgi:hypothetical protein
VEYSSIRDGRLERESERMVEGIKIVEESEEKERNGNRGSSRVIGMRSETRVGRGEKDD